MHTTKGEEAQCISSTLRNATSSEGVVAENSMPEGRKSSILVKQEAATLEAEHDKDRERKEALWIHLHP